MLTDTISDFIIQIKNGYMAKKEVIVVSFSNTKEAIAKILTKEGYLKTYEVKKITEIKEEIKVKLKYKGKEASITDIIRISKPGRRVYVKSDKIPKILGGIGKTIVSTSKGLMTGDEARKNKIGGELICKFW